MKARLALIACALLVGCAAPPSKVEPSGRAAIAIPPAQKHVTASVALRELVTITLPPAQHPGHEWQIALHDTRYLQQSTDFLPAESPEAGTRVSFIALRQGRTRLRFVLLPLNAGRAVDSIDLREVVLAIE